VVDELVIGVAELRLDWATLELMAEEVLAWLVETWGILTEETGGTRLEELWEVDDPDIAVEAAKALDTETPTLANGAWLVEETRGIMLDDAETVSSRLTLGTFDDDTLRLPILGTFDEDALRLLMLGTLRDDAIRLLLLLDATGMTTTELLLNEVGKLTADDVALKLGRTLDSVTLVEGEIAGCEESTATLTVGEDTTSTMMLLEAPTVLEAIAGWEGMLEVTESAVEELCGLADDKDVWLGMTPILVLPTPMLTT
jgi:hypothetical protein